MSEKCANTANGEHAFPPDVFRQAKLLQDYLHSAEDESNFAKLIDAAYEEYRDRISKQIMNAWKTIEREDGIDLSKFPLFATNEINKRAYQTMISILTNGEISGGMATAMVALKEQSNISVQ